MWWCSATNMWCSDMDEEDIDNANCNGDCDVCSDCEDIKSNIGVPLY